MKALNYSILFAGLVSTTFLTPAAQASLIAGTDYVSSSVSASYRGAVRHEIANDSTLDNDRAAAFEKRGEIYSTDPATSYTVDAWAKTDYGYNRALAALSVSGLSRTTMSVNANSIYQSIWTISPPPGAQVGDWGSATVGVNINGIFDGYQDDPGLTASFSYVLKCDDGACAETQQDPYDDYNVILTSTNLLAENQRRGEFNSMLSGELGFFYGEAFELRSSLNATVGVNGRYSEGYSGWGLSDLSSTVALTYLDLPEGAFLTTGTGTSFPVSYGQQPPGSGPRSVPEPASGILMGTGLLGLILARRRKMQNNKEPLRR